MKTLLALLLLTLSCSAQNLLVTFWPNNQPYTGLTNWPQGVKPVSFSTNAPGWTTNMTEAQYVAHVAARQAVYNTGSSNEVWQAQKTLSDKVDVVLNKIDDLQKWEDISGTNTLSTAQMNKAINDLCTAMRRLRPVIKKLCNENANDL